MTTKGSSMDLEVRSVHHVFVVPVFGSHLVHIFMSTMLVYLNEPFWNDISTFILDLVRKKLK